MRVAWGPTSSSGTCAHSPAPCSSIGICQRTPELAGSPLAPRSLHRWESGSQLAHRQTVMPPATSWQRVWRSVMVWGGISLEGRNLHVLANGTLTAVRYRDEILRPIVRPYAGAVGPGFLLVQDNARPHVARVCRQFLDDKGIDAIDWPSRSPDLNPIENLWDVMYRCIRRHQVAPQTVQELTDALIQVWEEIPQDTIHYLIRSMPRRCQECIQARGGHTHYWATLWVVVMKFTQVGSACDLNFPLRFLFWFWIQPSVG